MRVVIFLFLCCLFHGNAAAEEKKEEKLSLEVKKTIRENAQQRFALLDLTFKPFDPSKGLTKENFYSEYPEDSYFEMSEMKKTHSSIGVMVLEEGVFVFQNLNLRWSSIDTAKIRDLEGKTWEAEWLGVGPQNGFLYVRAKNFDKKVNVAQVSHRFEDEKKIAYVGLMNNTVRGKYRLRVYERKVKALRFVGEEAKDVQEFDIGGTLGTSEVSTSAYSRYSRYGHRSTVEMIYNDQGQFIGLPSIDIVRQSKSKSSYEKGGIDALEDLITEEKRKNYEDILAKQIAKNFRLVKLEFRMTNGDSGMSMYRSFHSSDDDSSSKEYKNYALCIGKHQLLLPVEMTATRISKLVKVSYKDDTNAKWQEAKFSGVFKQFGAMMFETKEPLDSYLQVNGSDLNIAEAVHCAQIKDRFGKKDIQYMANRVFGWSKGYKDRRYIRFFNRVPQGSFVFDAKGQLRAVTMKEKKYESKSVGEGNRYSYSYRYRSSSSRVFQFNELESLVDDPQKHFDTKIKPMTIQEAKKLAWLGVEFQGLSKDLIDALKLKNETRDGRYGLLVTTVYKGSPADKLGIKEGDLLLRIQEKSKAEQIELKSDGERYSRFSYFGFYGMYAGPDESWFDRKNTLTDVLTRLRVGTETILYYSHNHKIKQVDYKIEEAPLDYNSAVKYKNEDTGLTVKNVTYEVEHRLRLKNRKGVVVYKVEEGSPAAVSGITPLDFILGISKKGDEVTKNITSREDFKKSLEKLIKEGVDEATMMVKNLKNTRFVNVKLNREEVDPQKLLESLMKSKKKNP